MRDSSGPPRGTRLPRSRSSALVALILAVGLTAGACSGQEELKATTTTGTAAPVDTTTTTEVPLEDGKQLYVYTPAIGDCFDKRKIPGQNNKSTEVTLRFACDLPHEFEIYALVDYPAPDPKSTDPTARDFPDDDVLRKHAQTECPKRYQDYVGTRYELSKLEIGYVMPQKANWPGNRTIGCSVYRTGAKLDRSARGSAI